METKVGATTRTLRLYLKAKLGFKASEDGFGLIEVVVAAIILLIFSMMLLSANVTSLSISLFAKEHSTATSIMTATIAQAEAAGYNGAASLSKQKSETLNGITYTISYSYSSTAPSSTTTTSTTSTTSTSNGLAKISVTVSWSNDGTKYYVHGATELAQ